MLLHFLYRDSANGGELGSRIEGQMIARNKGFNDPGAGIERADDEAAEDEICQTVKRIPRIGFVRS